MGQFKSYVIEPVMKVSGWLMLTGTSTIKISIIVHQNSGTAENLNVQECVLKNVSRSLVPCKEILDKMKVISKTMKRNAFEEGEKERKQLKTKPNQYLM